MDKENKYLKEKLNNKLNLAIEYFEKQLKEKGNKKVNECEMLLLLDILTDFSYYLKTLNQEKDK